MIRKSPALPMSLTCPQHALCPFALSFPTCEGKIVISALPQNCAGQGLVTSGRALPTAKPSRTFVYSQLLTRQAFQLGQVGWKSEVRVGCAVKPRSSGAVGWGAVTMPAGPAFPGQPCPGCPTRPLPQPLGRALAGLPAVCTGSRMIGEAGGKG